MHLFRGPVLTFIDHVVSDWPHMQYSELLENAIGCGRQVDEAFEARYHRIEFVSAARSVYAI